MIGRVLSFAFVVLLGIFFQSNVIASFSPDFVAPDLLLPLSIYFGLTQRNVKGVCLSFLVGLIGDFAAGAYLGLHSFAYLVSFFVTIFLANKVYAEKALALVFISFICSLVKSFSVLLLLYLYANIPPFQEILLYSAFWEALGTAIASPLVIRMIK